MYLYKKYMYYIIPSSNHRGKPGLRTMARHRPFLVLEHNLGDGESVVPAGWAVVECATKAAYGCGPLGHHIVHGLSLLARLAGDDHGDNQYLRVRATDDLLRRVGSEMDDTAAAGIRFLAHVEAVEATVAGGGVMVVMSVRFIASNNGKDRGSYYLVYDSGAGGSLSLLPHCLLPHGRLSPCAATATATTTPWSSCPA